MSQALVVIFSLMRGDGASVDAVAPSLVRARARARLRASRVHTGAPAQMRGPQGIRQLHAVLGTFTAFAAAHVGYIVSTAASMPEGLRDTWPQLHPTGCGGGADLGWCRYEQVCLRLVDSGYISQLFLCFLVAFFGGDREHRRVGRAYVWLNAAPLAPLVLTHVLPAAAAYVWVVAPAAAIARAASRGLRRCMRRRVLDSKFYLPLLLLLRVGSCVIITSVIQALTHYAVMVYAYGPGTLPWEYYLGVFETEFAMRSTTCYVSRIARGAAADTLSAASFVLS